MECGVDKITVINGLKNYQSIIGYRRNCHATSAYSMNVSFIHPELNIERERGQIFQITYTSNLRFEKVSKDTVKIIYSGSESDISTKVENMYGIEFIYVNTWKIKKEKN